MVVVIVVVMVVDMVVDMVVVMVAKKQVTMTVTWYLNLVNKVNSCIGWCPHFLFKN